MNCSACGRHSVVLNRREFLAKSALGFGALALGDLLARDAARGATTAALPNPLAPKKPPLPPTAKNVILLFMQGGPSHMDTFDPKPELTRRDGQPLPDSFKADDLSVVPSCYHDAFIHGPALTLLLSGSIFTGHPSFGSWVLYGLGSESENQIGRANV